MAAAGLGLGLLVLWLRVGWLQVVRHAHYEMRAQLNQEQRVLVRPVRGSLLDRRGRVLARDLETYSVSAAPREMRDPAATARDLGRILGLDARKLARDFAGRPRYLWVARRISPVLGTRVADLHRDGVYLSLETKREQVLGSAASEILGSTNLDDTGIEGLELQLDDELRGHPGWVTRIRDGRGRPHAVPRGMRRDAEDGHQVVLTLDADLQSIVEGHLAAAVDTLHAKRGFAVFLDPRTGEILASVDVPHLPPGKMRNWNFTDQYEPGSTFKVVTAGAVLEEELAKPDQVFEAGLGRTPIAPGAAFADVHHQKEYTFFDAMRWSSNIVMGRLGLLLGPERLYRYATSLGFGSLTGVEFPGEVGGKLRSPSQWSARSCPTIAIGHEIAVTALQLALAYGAVANGGVLMRPQLVREIRDSDGNVLQRDPPQASHRVFSEATTRTLRTMLAAVVDSGTARAAQVPGLHVGGKTGTAQKYDPRIGTYGRNMYVSSFAGMAPVEAPTLVGVVVVDEPKGRHHYGGDAAAPVFRETLLDLLRLPHGPFEVDPAAVAARPPAPAPTTVPDLRLLTPRLAERTLEARGLMPHLHGEGDRVLAQLPAAGAAVERGAAVTLWLAAPQDSSGQVLPDLTGLPVREALRELGLRRVQPHIEGRGRVVRQSPAPGTRLPLGGPCRLWCEPGVEGGAGMTVVATAPGAP